VQASACGARWQRVSIQGCLAAPGVQYKKPLLGGMCLPRPLATLRVLLPAFPNAPYALSEEAHPVVWRHRPGDYVSDAWIPIGSHLFRAVQAGPNGLLRTGASCMGDTIYVLGHSQAEIRRLIKQASILQATTERLLRSAGIERGMRVLDLRCGAGDVSMLAGKLVGASGSSARAYTRRPVPSGPAK
jgi:hypothetical protein